MARRLTSQISREYTGRLYDIGREKGKITSPQNLEEDIPKVEKIAKKIIKVPSLREMTQINNELKKIRETTPKYVMDFMINNSVPLSYTNAQRINKQYERDQPLNDVVGGMVTGFIKGVIPIDVLSERILEDMKLTIPLTKKGKTIQNWTSWATLMLNPVSPYRFLPGGKILGKLGKTKVLQLIDKLIRNKVTEKALPYVYKTMGNALSAGINMPLFTLAEDTVNTVLGSRKLLDIKRRKLVGWRGKIPVYEDVPKYDISLVRAKETIVPSMVLGGALGLASKILPKLGKGLVKKLTPKTYEKLMPINWAKDKLNVRVESDFNIIQNNFKKVQNVYNNSVKTDKVIDEFRNMQKAYNILAEINGKLVSTQKLPITEKALKDRFSAVEDVYFRKKDGRLFANDMIERSHKKNFRKIVGEKKYNQKVQDMDYAMQIYIDTKRDPGVLKRAKPKWKTLNPEDKRVIILSQNLPKKVKEFARRLQKRERRFGLEGQETGIIKNTIDNHVNRVWDAETLGIRKKQLPLAKFKTTSVHRLQRKYPTIIDGLLDGGKLKVKGAINSHHILAEEFVRTIENKNFLKMLRKLKTIDGRPFISPIQYGDYKRINHPNFSVWVPAKGLTKEARNVLKAQKKFHTKNFFIAKNGQLMARSELYAPKKTASIINKMFDPSALQKIPFIKKLIRFNAFLKAMRLQYSFFHHFAFTRSYWLGAVDKKWKNLNLRQAYKGGIEQAEKQAPIVKLGVEEGLTLGLKQDWNESLLREKTKIGKLLDKWKAPRKVKNAIVKLRERHVDFLFGEFGAGLKAKAYLIEMNRLQKQYPKAKLRTLARMSANLINDDFGGLHLQRMHRSATVQDIFRLFSLAPDWTESNIRSMYKAIRTGQSANMYRRFWARVFKRGIILSITANILMNGRDTIDVYKRMYEEKGFLGLMDVDVTNLYRFFYGKKADTNRRYLSLFFGHFRDPLKALSYPAKFLFHKGSLLGKLASSFLFGRDWAGRTFTTLPELLGIDYGKGKYITTREGFYKEGDPKWGKLKGKTVKWRFRASPVSYSTFISWLLQSIKSSVPTPVDNMMAYILGEQDAFQTFLGTVGLQPRKTFGGDISAKRKGFTIIDEIEKEEEKEPGEYETEVIEPTEPIPLQKEFEPIKEKLEKKVEIKPKSINIRKMSNEEFANFLHTQKTKDMSEKEKMIYTHITNIYKIQTRSLSLYLRRNLLKKTGKDFLKYMIKRMTPEQRKKVRVKVKLK